MRRKDADYKGFVSFDNNDVITYWQWIIEIVDEVSKYFEEKHKERLYSLIDNGNAIIKK